MISSGITAPFGKVQAPDAIPEFGVRYLFIPHPFATNHTLDYSIVWSVRLACLSHAASVRSEPGSNSSVCIVDSASQKRDRTLQLGINLKIRSRNEKRVDSAEKKNCFLGSFCTPIWNKERGVINRENPGSYVFAALLRH